MPVQGEDWLDALPGSLGWPVVGNTLSFYRDYLGGIEAGYERYGPVFKSHVLGEPTIALLEAEANRYVLADTTGRFSSWGGWQQGHHGRTHARLRLRQKRSQSR